ncbi:PREDICTED: uncharacterized protein C11orf86 homolog [Condylura cristata]|uniref:uncharacterized protein C11orf86 homolog n=1 Tax=Condylura cristata TaxID=143302 RepID=UPI000643E272|nr:PREDICTED: uncharacterized protein C11orf86 homolog [Condylura cristata]
MSTGPRSQSLRAPRRAYGQLQEAGGKPSEGRLRRSRSLRQEKLRQEKPDGGPDGPDGPGPETLGDTEQLIRAQRGGSRGWLKQYRQVCWRVRRRWQSFVASLPSVTLSWPASLELPPGPPTKDAGSHSSPSMPGPDR